MIFNRLGLIHKNQRGFTLTELVIAIAISGIIAGTATGTIFQVFSGSTRSNNHMVAVRQVQNAGYWVSRDTQMAQSMMFDDPATTDVTEFLTLSWTEWDTSDVHRVAYTLEDISGSELKNLRRSHSINGVDSESAVIAQFIDPANTNCDEDADGTLLFTVTATVQEQSETRVYEVISRPGS